MLKDPRGSGSHDYSPRDTAPTTCATFREILGSGSKAALSRTGWRTGTARILDDDDPQERMRILSRGNRWRRLCLQASTAIATDPVTVRIDLDPR